MLLISVHIISTQEDAVRQLQVLQSEIQDSMNELEEINPLYENQVEKEKEITKEYVYDNEIQIVRSFFCIVCFNF